MPKILKIKNANDYSRYVGLKDKHPLVSVVEYADVSPVRSSLNNYEVYALFMQRYIDVELKYGCGKYDYRGGTLFLPISCVCYPIISAIWLERPSMTRQATTLGNTSSLPPTRRSCVPDGKTGCLRAGCCLDNS